MKLVKILIYVHDRRILGLIVIIIDINLLLKDYLWRGLRVAVGLCSVLGAAF